MNGTHRPTRALAGTLSVLLLSLSCDGLHGEDVRFTSGDVTLAGTLLRPKQRGAVPAVVLIHGSGEADRRSLRSYAKAFVRNGFAALVYDKRGVGESEGDPDAWSYFSFDDLASDAVSAVRHLAERDDIDADRIGLFGASQGGWVAPLAASRSEHVAFLVLLSASVSTVAEDRVFERAARLGGEGFTESEIEEVREMQLVDQELTRSGRGFDEFSRLWEQNESERWFRRVYLSEDPIGAEHSWRLWYRTVLDFDPLPILEQLSIPTLWLYGDPAHDRFGPVRLSLDRLEALKRAGKPYEIVSFEGTDHNLERVQGRGEAPWKDELSRWSTTVALDVTARPSP